MRENERENGRQRVTDQQRIDEAPAFDAREREQGIACKAKTDGDGCERQRPCNKRSDAEDDGRALRIEPRQDNGERERANSKQALLDKTRAPREGVAIVDEVTNLEEDEKRAEEDAERLRHAYGRIFARRPPHDPGRRAEGERRNSIGEQQPIEDRPRTSVGEQARLQRETRGHEHAERSHAPSQRADAQLSAHIRRAERGERERHSERRARQEEDEGERQRADGRRREHARTKARVRHVGCVIALRFSVAEHRGGQRKPSASSAPRTANNMLGERSVSRTNAIDKIASGVSAAAPA